MTDTDTIDSVGNLGFEQKDKIKLIKNSRGYAWEISILSLDIDKLEQLNNTMREKFGSLE